MDSIGNPVASTNAHKIEDEELADKINRLTNRVTTLRIRCKETNSIEELNSAIEAMEEIVELTPNVSVARILQMNNLGNAIYSRYERLGSMEDLNKAIRLHMEAASSADRLQTSVENLEDTYEMCLESLVDDLQERYSLRGSADDDLESALNSLEDVYKTALLRDIGDVLQDRFELKISLASISLAIVMYRKALCYVTTDMDRASTLNELGVALQRRFDLINRPIDLQEAVDAKAAAVEHSLPDDPKRAMYLNNLSTALQIKADLSLGDPLENLDNAVAASEEASALATNFDDNSASMYLDNMGLALLDRFKHSGSITDLEKAVSSSREAVKLAELDDPGRRRYLNNFSNVLQERFDRLQIIDDIDEAVGAADASVIDMHNGDASRPNYLHNFATALHRRYLHSRSQDDLERAVIIATEAVDTSHDDEYRASYLHDLAQVILSRFELQGSIKDLEHAITLVQQAKPYDLKEPLRRGKFLNTLCNILLVRFDHIGSPDDLNSSISAGNEALLTTNIPPSDRRMFLTNLGNALQRRFEQTGSKADLDAAIEKRKAATEGSQEDPAPLVAGSLTNLGNVFQTRYRLIGSLTDLNDAIQAHQKAIQIIDGRNPDRALYLNNLGLCLQDRGEHLGSMDDINGAIVAHNTAVDTATDQSRRSRYLTNLAISLQQRFLFTGSTEDIYKAVIKADEAVKLTPNNNPNLAGRLTVLGGALWRRFKKTDSLEDLNQAILYYQEAIECTPVEHVERGVRLGNLGKVLETRYAKTDSSDDLEEAIKTCQAAIDCISSDHPDRASCLHALSNVLQRRFQKSGSTDDLENALIADETAAYLSSAPPRVRAIAAKSAAGLLGSTDFRRVSQLLNVAVARLPEISPRTLARNDQQRMIAEFAGLTSTATAALLQAEGNGKDAAIKALELLEMGRGVMASLQLETRTDITELEKEHPLLAQEFKSLQDKLDAPLQGFSYDEFGEWNQVATGPAERITIRHAYAQRFTLIVNEIRELKSFERFLLPPSESELRALAKPGPIVVINIAAARSDAFLITSSDISCLPLPDLRHTDIAKKSMSFMISLDKLRQRTYSQTTRELMNVLEWLWTVAAGPILYALGFKEAPSKDAVWPKVWWVLGGWLNVLPIHAAGFHYNNSTQNVLDRVISAYTPTVKALSYSRNKEAKISIRRQPNVLFISMPDTPGIKELPHVPREVAELDAIIPTSISKLTLATPIKMEVQEHLSNRAIVHFACHATSTLLDPSKSCLLLKDWQTNPYSVTDIVSMNLQHSQMAYLSACHAARSRVGELLDEGIHLAGACQLAGFPHVIATLWQIEDARSVEVAKEVYGSMIFQDAMDVRQAARGLHIAVRRLRDQVISESGNRFRESPLVWAPYIYLGA